jgi:hypothetical protein
MEKLAHQLEFILVIRRICPFNARLSKKVENRISKEDLFLQQWKLIDISEIKGIMISWKGNILTLNFWNEISVKNLMKLLES